MFISRLFTKIIRTIRVSDNCPPIDLVVGIVLERVRCSFAAVVKNGAVFGGGHRKVAARARLPNAPNYAFLACRFLEGPFSAPKVLTVAQIIDFLFQIGKELLFFDIEAAHRRFTSVGRIYLSGYILPLERVNKVRPDLCTLA